MPRSGWAARQRHRIQRLVRARKRRLRARRAVRDAAPLLRRGLYVSDGAQAWRHWRQAPPHHLAWSKGSPGVGVARHVAKVLLVGAHPVLNLRSNAYGFTIVVASHDDDLVLMNPETRKVVRTNRNHPITTEQLELRERFARYLPTPAWEVREGGQVLVEEYVEGRAFLALSPSARLGVVREIFARTTDLVRAEARPSPSTCMDHMRGALRNADVPVEARTAVLAVLPADGEPDWPCVPSTDDAVVDNLIVPEQGGPVLLDLRMTLRPFPYVPLGLLASERSRVMAAFVGGELDEELGRLFSAAGVELPEVDDLRTRLLWLPPVIDAYREATRHSPFDQDRFEHQVRRRWHRLATGSTRPV